MNGIASPRPGSGDPLGEATADAEAAADGDAPGDDEAPGADGEGEPDDDDQGAADQAGDGAVGDGCELLIGEGDGAGDADRGLSGADEFELGGGGAEGGGGGGTRLQRAVVEAGLGEDEAVWAGEVGGGAGEEALP